MPLKQEIKIILKEAMVDGEFIHATKYKDKYEEEKYETSDDFIKTFKGDGLMWENSDIIILL